MGRPLAHEPAHLQPPLPAADGHVLFGVAAARLCGAGAGAPGVRAAGYHHCTGLRLSKPGGVLHDVSPRAGQPSDGVPAAGLVCWYYRRTNVGP
ncbi:hypothetical protein G6F35_015668 [Rhizopus arrhizus]|nr:hypothetical protein G6F35_015668 [Rhizopus arrhizus]